MCIYYIIYIYIYSLVTITWIKCKKSEINQYANRYEPFHRKITIFGVDTCMVPNFKLEE